MDVEMSRTAAPRAAVRGFCALLVGTGLGRFGYPPLIPLLIRDGWFTAAQADYPGAVEPGWLRGGFSGRGRAGASY